MDVLSILGLVLALLIFIPVFYVLRESNRPPLPGPGLLEYLPNGLVYPMFKDAGNFTDVMEKLGDTYGNVFSLWLGPGRVIVTSVPADLVHMSSNSQVFQRTKMIQHVFNLLAPGGVFTMRGEAHRAVRRKLRDSFNHTMLKSFHPHMTEAIDELCESLAAAAPKENGSPAQVVDMSEFLAVTTFRVITNVAFGSNMDRARRLEFMDNVIGITEEMMLEYIRYPVRQALSRFGSRNKLYEHRRKILNACNQFIQQRVAETKEETKAREPNILDAILDLEDHPAEAVASLTVEFAIAGSHTTNQILVWSIYETCCNPRVVSEIVNELSTHLGDRPMSDPLSLEDMQSLPYMTSVWKETCRLHAVGSSISRRVMKDVTLKGSGIRVPKDSEIYGHFRRSQMDPDIWKKPKSFLPERWGSGTGKREGERVPPGAYMPFGVGQFSCAGRFLADYEGPLILAELHRRFKFALACEPSEVKNFTSFVDTPRYTNKETGVEMGVPVRVQLRESGFS